jgi:hypothetical protein
VLGVIAAAAGSAAGCDGTRPASDATTRLVERADARIEAAAVPAGLSAEVTWTFDRNAAAGSWRPIPPWNPTVPAVAVAETGRALRLELTDRTVNLNGFHVGGVFTDLSSLKETDWGAIEVEVSASAPFAGMAVGQNLRSGSGEADDNPWPFEDWVASVREDPGGGPHVLRANLPHPEDGARPDWRQLGLWFGADSPVTIEIVSIRLVPRDAPFADAPAGVLPVGAAPGITWPEESGPSNEALYMWTPARAEYSVQVPANGRLDVSLGVVRAEAAVRFRVIATPPGSESEVQLEEVLSDPARFVNRQLDLAHLAGQSVSLVLEAESATREESAAATLSNVALWREPTLYEPARLAVEVLDSATGERTPVRVRFTDAKGASAPLPEAAIGIQYGPNDVAAGYQFLPDSSFYVDGAFASEVPPGEYRIRVSKGYEYLEQEISLSLSPGEEVARSIEMDRWIDMPARGWYSADDHIHLRRSPRENPLILKWVAAEDIHVGALLQMGDFWTTYFAQYAWGRDGVYQLEDYMITSGQEEPRTHEIGHTISLAADDFVRFRGEYYHYDRVFDQVHALGGVSGYAHKGVGFHGYRGLTLDVLREKVDFIEVLQFCGADEPLLTDQYYHFLELGFELAALAGSDFPFCGRDNRIGDARFYTYLGNDFSFDGWRAALHAGRTFVSSGPMIELDIDGSLPGDRLEVPVGSTLQVRAAAFGHPDQVPLSRLEIVAHGQVIATATPDDPTGSAGRLDIDLELPAERGIWITARAHAGPGQAAHTTPVYVSVDGSGFHNPDTALELLDLNAQYLDEVEAEIAQPNQTTYQHAWRYREGLEERIAETRAVIARLRAQFEAERRQD